MNGIFNRALFDKDAGGSPDGGEAPAEGANPTEGVNPTEGGSDGKTEATGSPRKTAADLAFGDDLGDGDNKTEKIAEGPAERPSWCDEAHWDAEKGEVLVEKIAQSEKEAKKALRAKQGVPEPTEERPYGYDVSFMGESIGEEGEEGYVEGMDLPKEYVESQAFKDYAERQREAGASQKVFEANMREFFQWKSEYDNAMGYDINAEEEKNAMERHFTEEYGNKAKENFKATLRFMEDQKNMHPDVARALAMTAEGIKYAHKQMLGKIKVNPITTDETSVSNVGVNSDDIDKEISNLMQDPRYKLPASDPGRKAIENEINELYKQKAELSGPRPRKTNLNPNIGSLAQKYGPGSPDSKHAKSKIKR